jgi:hypothetical protein
MNDLNGPFGYFNKRYKAWSYQQKLSDLRNFQKKSEIFKPAVFARKVRKIK